MSVAVSCNLSDGVILGVDSAITVPGSGGVAKVYENAEKLFQLGKKPIGVAIFGLGTLGTRSIGSYLNEFEGIDPGGVLSKDSSLASIVEALRDFLMRKYVELVVPALEKQTQKKFHEIPPEDAPGLGLAIGGFSCGNYLSEVWSLLIPTNNTSGSGTLQRPQGEFGTNWFALFEPIRRYLKGYDPALINELKGYLGQLRGVPFSAQEESQLLAILQKYEYQIPFHAMSVQEGVAHVRFLVDLVINHYRFAVGAPVVGGRARIGMVTYRGGDFKILNG